MLKDTPYVPLFDREQYGSIQEIQLSNRIIVYPSPASEQITLEFDNLYDDMIELEITDLLGRSVFFTQQKISSMKLDVESWPAGSYIVSVRNQARNQVLSNRFFVD